MKKYYVNNTAQANGDYEVHHEGCNYFHLIKNRTYLGEFSSCRPAVAEAQKIHSKANGCIHCATECHIR